MDDLARIRADPASPAGQELLRGLLARPLTALAASAHDAAASDNDAGVLARMLSDVAQHQAPDQRAAAKAGAAHTEELADFLVRLGEAAREGFGGPVAW